MTTVRSEIYPFKFQIWERIRLTVGEEGHEGTYSCRISDIGKNRLVISRPVFERGNTLLANNRIVTVYCIRSDAAYSFSARLKETEPKSADQMYLLDLGAVKRVQRRRFVRLDKSIRMKYKTLPHPVQEPVDPETDKMSMARSLNLSAGGMLISIDGEMAVNDILLLAIESCGLDKLPPYLLAVCRHAGLRDNKQRVAGIEFILIEDLPHYLKDSELNLIPAEARRFDDSMQNALVSEIFAEQLVLRQKGLL